MNVIFSAEKDKSYTLRWHGRAHANLGWQRLLETFQRSSAWVPAASSSLYQLDTCDGGSSDQSLRGS